MPKVSADHLAARRRQILDAAGRCFARDGFHATSVHDIVRESGISAGLVYRYFTGKDDMIVAIVSEWHEQRRAVMEASTVDFDDLADAYLGLLRSIGDPSARDGLRLGVQVWAEAVRSPRIGDLTRAGIDGPRGSLAARVRSAQRNGEAPADLDPDALVRVFIAIYQGLVLQTVLDDGLDREAFVRTVESMLDAVIRRPPPSAGDGDR
ncbi:TetR/AcrR family transcriptional regulator [Virgisporangium ochraceum]|uniref:Putative transcriptional regulator, TetR family protein n=1 Tax=Virgisporangium ochraceum TaxID=65505 RepID=A0A8J4ECI8_9ACTN|nr:TetR/AcrR family transcriptional regulator [Virgisporangium ochraceum]GIJ69669.1 putative transcriptional regulator, TetR family protein [Virgisporangium ochraceum]